MQIRFLSVNYPESVGYIIAKSMDFMERSNNYRSTSVNWAREYATLGDGMTQHAYETPITKEHLCDFLESLLTYWQTAREDEKDMIIYESRLSSRISRKQIEFFLSLKYREEKPTYFDRNAYKISTSDSKRHDKRWSLVPSWVKGGMPTDAYALLYFEQYNPEDILGRYATYDAIRTVSGEINDYCGDHPTVFCGIGEENRVDHEFTRMFDIFMHYITAYTAEKWATESWERFQQHKHDKQAA